MPSPPHRRVQPADAPTTLSERSLALALALGLSGGLLLAGGCASSPDAGTQNLLGKGTQVTVSDPTRFTQSGFLSD